jgi:hypothetical protein
MHCVARACIGLVFLAAFLLANPVGAGEADKYWPDDSEFVLSIDVRQGLDSKVVKKHLLDLMKEAIENRAEVRQLLEATGLDPLRDIAGITAAGRRADDKVAGLVLVRGTFDLMKIQTAAKEWAKQRPEEVRIHEEGDHTIYEIPSKQPGRDPVFGAFLDKELLVLSPSKQSILEAAAKHAGKKSGAVSKDLQTLLSRTDRKQTLWLAALLTADLQKDLVKGVPKDKAVQLRSIQGGVLLTDRVRADFRLQTSDRRTAAELRKNLDGLRVLLRYGALNNKNIPKFAPLLAEMIGAVKITSMDNVVIFHAEVSDAQIEKTLRMGKTR